MGALATAYKTHTRFAIRAEYVDCADCGISNLLITKHAEWFNSVPGHHIFNQLALPQTLNLFHSVPKFQFRLAGVCLEFSAVSYD